MDDKVNHPDPTASLERRRLLDFARAVDGWLWETDAESRFTYMSENVEELTGLPAEWHYGKSREDLGAPDIPAEQWQAHLDVLKRQEPFREFIYRRRGPDGDVWLRSDGSPMFDDDGNFVGYRGIGRFVTPEVEAREEAKRSQQLLSAAIDGMNETFVLWDEENKLVLINEQFRSLNRDVDHLIQPGTFCEDYFRALAESKLAPEAIGQEEDWIARRIRCYYDGTPQEILRQDGRSFLVRDHKIPGVGTATVTIDITLQKKAELALLESEQRFRDIADVSTDWYWETDKDGHFTYFSDSMETETGIVPDNVLGLKRTEVVSQEFSGTQEWIEHLEDIQHQRAFSNLEYPYKRGDGTTGWTRVSGKPVFDSAGDFIGYRGAATEVSELHRIAEEMIAARERAEGANKAKTEFLSSISHELRTPMNSILGFSQLLAGDEDQPLTEDQSDSIQQIVKSGQHLLQLINEMLDLAQIESGRLTVESETVLLDDIVEECITSTSTLAENLDIKVFDRTSGGILLRVDRKRLRQVLLNLLSNAIKYNRPDGTVEILTESRGPNCRISVTDTGNGFDLDDQSKLFEPFNRLGWENSDTEGTGIGLAICKRLAIAMKGNIGCNSEPGKGSTFWVELPLDRHRIVRVKDLDRTKEKASQPERPSVVKSIEDQPKVKTSAAEKKILYIEDNKANVDLMVRVVKRLKTCSLLVAETAEKGLDIAASEQPDIIIMDINLPGMDGFEALQKLRSNLEIQSVPVIALSADAMPHQVQKGHEVGFHDYLTKPLDIPRFLDMINGLLARSTNPG